MLNSNTNSIFSLKLIKLRKSKISILAVTTGKGLKVIEKLGSVSGKMLNLNAFRLSFWLSKGVDIDFSTYKILRKVNIF